MCRNVHLFTPARSCPVQLPRVRGSRRRVGTYSSVARYAVARRYHARHHSSGITHSHVPARSAGPSSILDSAAAFVRAPRRGASLELRTNVRESTRPRVRRTRPRVRAWHSDHAPITLPLPRPCSTRGQWQHLWRIRTVIQAALPAAESAACITRAYPRPPHTCASLPHTAHCFSRPCAREVQCGYHEVRFSTSTQRRSKPSRAAEGCSVPSASAASRA